MPARAAAFVAVFVSAACLVASAPEGARGAVGIGTSPVATIDTVEPIVVLDALPANLLVQGGQSVTFHWTTFDDHPGTTAADFTAEVRDGDTPLGSIDYLASPTETTWAYEAPEIMSGYVRLVVACRDAFGNTTTTESSEFTIVLSTSGTQMSGLPGMPVIEGNVPNPCNPGTNVRFSLPAAQTAVLTLYAANGALVRRLADGHYAAGTHEVFWDGRDDQGRAAASGTYLLRLATGDRQQSRKLALVR